MNVMSIPGAERILVVVSPSHIYSQEPVRFEQYLGNVDTTSKIEMATLNNIMQQVLSSTTGFNMPLLPSRIQAFPAESNTSLMTRLMDSV